MSTVFTRNRKGKTHRENGAVKTGVDRGLMLLESKKCQGRQSHRRLGEGQGVDSLLEFLPKEPTLLDILISGSWTPDCEKTNGFCLSYPVCSNLFPQPQESNMSRIPSEEKGNTATSFPCILNKMPNFTIPQFCPL